MGFITFLTTDGLYRYEHSQFTKIDFEDEILLIHHERDFTVIVTDNDVYMNTYKGLDKAINFPREISLISCGIEHLVFTTVDGLYGRGVNTNGQLGLGHFNGTYDCEKIDFHYKILSITCGYDHTILNTTDGLYGCGVNTNNQLGLDAAYINKFTKIEFPYKILSVHCGEYYTIINSIDGLYINNTYYGDKFVKMNFQCKILSVHCSDNSALINTSNGLYYRSDTDFGLGDDESIEKFTKIDFLFDIIQVYYCDNKAIINSTNGLYTIENYNIIKLDFPYEIIELNTKRLKHTKSARN